MEIKKDYLKYGAYGFNVMFCIMGFILLGVGIWAEIGIEDMESLLSDKMITNASILLMLSGSMVILLSCVGVVAVKKESRKVLVWLCLSIVVVFGLEFAGGLYAFTNRKEVRNQLKSGISNVLTTSYGGHNSKSRVLTNAFDWIQKNVKCCGAEHPGDWEQHSAWYKKVVGEDGGGRVLVPASCCTKDIDGCNQGVDIQSLWKRKSIYRNGCTIPADKYMKKYFAIVGKIGMVIAFFQLIGIVLLYSLSRKLKGSDGRNDGTAMFSTTDGTRIQRSPSGVDKSSLLKPSEISKSSLPPPYTPATGPYTPATGQPAINAPTTGRQPAINAPTAGRHPAINAPTTGRQPAINAPTAGRHPAINAPTAGRHPAINAPTTGPQPVINIQIYS